MRLTMAGRVPVIGGTNAAICVLLGRDEIGLLVEHHERDAWLRSDAKVCMGDIGGLVPA